MQRGINVDSLSEKYAGISVKRKSEKIYQEIA